jgi:hypothetical protein
MFFLIVQQIILSLIFIFIVHYIYLFMKNNLTIPKTKDLVKKPLEQYKQIYKNMSNNNTNMKNELKEYINSKKNDVQINTANTNNTNFSYYNNNNFSEDEDDDYGNETSEWLNVQHSD